MSNKEEINQLKQEIADFAADREVRELRQQLEDLKNPKVNDSQRTDDLKQARVRCVQCGVWHFIGGPIASWVYSAKTNNYIPSLVGTGIAIVGLPLALVDLGLTLCVGAPVAAAALHITNTTEKRRKLGIELPEEADKLLICN